MNGGDLKGLLDANGGQKVDEVQSFAFQIGSALNYCHGRGVIHCNLKPENILLHVNGELIFKVRFRYQLKVG